MSKPKFLSEHIDPENWGMDFNRHQSLKTRNDWLGYAFAGFLGLLAGVALMSYIVGPLIN